MIQNLIKKFNAKSKVHLLIIFFVFGLSGSFSLWISSPIMAALDLKNILNNYPLYLFIRVLIIQPDSEFANMQQELLSMGSFSYTLGLGLLGYISVILFLGLFIKVSNKK